MMIMIIIICYCRQIMMIIILIIAGRGRCPSVNVTAMLRPPQPPPLSRSPSWRRSCSGRRSLACCDISSRHNVHCSTILEMESTILREGVNKCHPPSLCRMCLLYIIRQLSILLLSSTLLGKTRG